MRYPVLVDTSAFHALENRGDILEHQTAKQVAEKLEADAALLVTTDYILDETYTLLRSVLGHNVAVAFGHEIQKGGIEVVQVDERIQKEAGEIFEWFSDPADEIAEKEEVVRSLLCTVCSKWCDLR